MKKFIVAVVYTGKSKMLVPSRWYKIEASTKSIAASRALAKAQADNPRYSSYSATVDTLSARKIKRFNREFGEVRDKMKELQNEFDRYIYYSNHSDDDERCYYDYKLKFLDDALTFHEPRYFQMLELHNVING